MTRLARHDEIVERMAEDLCKSAWADGDTEFEWASRYCKREIWRSRARLTLDALLTAVVELGVGHHVGPLEPLEPPNLPIHSPALILQLEDKP